MSTLIVSQMKDAIAFAEGLKALIESLPEEPRWGGGERMCLPMVIELRSDYPGDSTRAWLVANDFDGYDITTTDPKKATT